jgi:hypothetical protein
MSISAAFYHIKTLENGNTQNTLWDYFVCNVTHKVNLMSY